MIIGRFIDLNAEEAERSVEKYFTAINKAAKFFNKLELKEQAETANLIKVFVPLYVLYIPSHEYLSF
jgi:hypothetical protein